MKKLFGILVLGLLFNLYFLVYAVDLPDYYTFPKNYLKGKFYDSFKDYFIVATNKNTDPRFKNSVIVMLDHDEKGALGIIINKPLGKIPLGSLINKEEETTNNKKELYDVKIPVFWGGPLDNNKILILHSNDYKNKTTKNYINVSISSGKKVLFEIAEKKGPKNSLVILGVSAWSVGQLEGEMEKEIWALSEIDADLIFKIENEKKWLNAIKNQFVPL